MSYQNTLAKHYFHFLAFVIVFLISGCGNDNSIDSTFFKAQKNAIAAKEGFSRSIAFTKAWLRTVDHSTGLFPEKLYPRVDNWLPRNNAADNFPFMVLSAYILDKELYDHQLMHILKTEQQLTNRINRVPDAFSLTSHSFVRDTINLTKLFFEAAEYVKDGLIPIMEYVGQSPYTDRMIEILDDLEPLYEKMMQESIVDAPLLTEINGDLLISLTRAYWFTRDRKYLDWAIRIGDIYMFQPEALQQNPHLRLRDHGSEIIPGLSELYVALTYERPKKAAEYKPILHRTLDNILEYGTNHDGLFYSVIDLKNSKPIRSDLADTWGYILNAYYIVYLVDNESRYLAEVDKVLKALPLRYRGLQWDFGHDGIADAVEGAIYLFNRTHISEVESWINSEIRRMYRIQRRNGIVGGWHSDGNFARTALMHALWKTQGITAHPWRKDVLLGAERHEDHIYMYLNSDTPWVGVLQFDYNRSKKLGFPLDYPRINQFPLWFTADDSSEYAVIDRMVADTLYIKGQDLIGGIHIETKGEQVLLEIYKR